MDSSACDTETEERKIQSRNNLNRQKFIRSKSSSPNRQVSQDTADSGLIKIHCPFYAANLD